MAAFSPASPKQQMILESKAQILVAGGAAGSGKSYLLNLMPLLMIDDPNTNCVIFRRTVPQITGAGGIWDTANSIYNQLPKQFRPRVRERNLEFIFPNGAKIKHQSMQREKDKINSQGLQYTMVGFDEGCQFTWGQIEYLLSRLRSESKYPSRMVITCNPDPDHKIKELIQWYLDEEGYPIPEREGKIRYFVARDGEMHFANTEEELKERFGEKVLCLSFSFISATIFDNPPMLNNNPEYLAFLEGLNPTDKARLLHGNWEARPEGDSFFKREWLQNVNSAPSHTNWCRSWDKAGTERTTENKYPDATACVKVGKDKDGKIYLAGDYHPDCYDSEYEVHGRFCEKVGRRDVLIERQAHFDGRDCTVVFPIDPAAAGKLEYTESARKLNELGFIVKPDPAPNNKSKLTKASPFFSAAENGNVYILRHTFDSKTYEFLMKELEAFNGERSTSHRKDDLVDSVASGYSYLSTAKSVRAFTMPTINAPTNFANNMR